MKQTLILLTLLAGLTLSSGSLYADDLEQLAGTWSVNKTNDMGNAYTQTIEIKKDKLTFKIVGADKETYLYAQADVKLEKFGPFQGIKVMNIKAGRSADELEPVDDDRTMIYRLGWNTWTLASNFDKERDQEPALDVYKKVTAQK